MKKYPRTPHLEGSRQQQGDDLSVVSLGSLLGKHCVIEEKLDGANCGVSFDDGTMTLQSRGHVLTGGAREKHFNLFKQWAHAHEHRFREVLGERFVMYGEWMFAKHSMFYNNLPHFFLEFDVLDKHTKTFLDTPSRHTLLQDLPVVHVPVLWASVMERGTDLDVFMGKSLGRTPEWKEDLAKQSERFDLHAEKVLTQTDGSDDGEGLYIKHEENGHVVGRFKYIRHSFTQTILDADEHWHRRPILPNTLNPKQDIFAPTINKSWPVFVPQSKRKKKW